MPARWPTPSWRRCGRAPAANTSTCATAFGRSLAFLTGWTSFVAGFSGAIAASAVVLAVYLGRFVPGAADDARRSSSSRSVRAADRLTPQSLVAIAAIVALSLVHVVRRRPGRIVQNVLAALKVLGAVTSSSRSGCRFGAGSSANPAGRRAVTVTGGWLLALIPVMFTYSGWNAGGYVAEEIRDPGRNVPLALAHRHGRRDR